MRVTHIYHSGFAVELKGCNLLFDWYTGELPPLRRDVPLVVFVSHEHSDHYGRCIWRLPNSFSDVRYVVDRAVAEQAPQGRDVLPVEPEGDYCIDLGTDAGTMEVRTLESNDEGVAFLVRACGRTVYFSGDLNVWWWNRPKAQNEASERFFRGELERIANADVDAAFVPLDPRLEDPVAGIAAYMDVVGARDVFPMHYWHDAEDAQECLSDPRLVPYAARLHFEDVCELPE